MLAMILALALYQGPAFRELKVGDIIFLGRQEEEVARPSPGISDYTPPPQGEPVRPSPQSAMTAPTPRQKRAD